MAFRISSPRHTKNHQILLLHNPRTLATCAHSAPIDLAPRLRCHKVGNAQERERERLCVCVCVCVMMSVPLTNLVFSLWPPFPCLVLQLSSRSPICYAATRCAGKALTQTHRILNHIAAQRTTLQSLCIAPCPSPCPISFPFSARIPLYRSH